MRIFDAIRESMVRRVPSPVRHLVVHQEEESLPFMGPEDFVRRRISVTLFTDMTGRRDDGAEMTRRALRMFAHELYGEVADELMEVLRILYEDEDRYRPPGDPVLTRINSLVDKLRGKEF